MKLFISQPMRDRLPEALELERETFLQEFKRRHPNEDVEVVKSYDPSLAKMPKIYALGFSIQMLGQADYAVFLPNWETSRGCRIEHQVCMDYGIDHLDLSDHYGKD